MAQSCDVLSRRQQPLQVESPKIGQLLTEYGKFRVEELKKGKEIPPEMVRRMKLLVNQDRYLETLAENLDDSIARLEIDAGKVSGRSARVKRRVDMMLEEIQGIQESACQNFVGLASDPTLAAAFGIAETRRQNELRNAAGAVGM